MQSPNKDMMKEEPDIIGEEKKITKSPRIERNLRIKLKRHKIPDKAN